LGYYHANERPEDGELGFAARRIADKVHANCPSACALLVRVCVRSRVRARVCVLWRCLTNAGVAPGAGGRRQAGGAGGRVAADCVEGAALACARARAR
jgi:hypothetical protein